MRLHDLTGRRFGRYTVIAQAPGRAGKTVWRCRCDCGNERSVTATTLKRGQTMSCGCLRPSLIAESRRTHGMRKSPEYRNWLRMRERCEDEKCPAFLDYGGRGIRVCERWQDFALFFADVGPRPSPRHSLDRIDNDRGYEPGNVRWATAKEQQRNRRNNAVLTYAGRTACLAEWAESTRLPAYLIRRRIVRGMSAADALTTPRGAAPGERFRV